MNDHGIPEVELRLFVQSDGRQHILSRWRENLPPRKLSNSIGGLVEREGLGDLAGHGCEKLLSRSAARRLTRFSNARGRLSVMFWVSATTTSVARKLVKPRLLKRRARGPSCFERRRRGYREGSGGSFRTPRNIVWRGPPFFKRARTRSTSTVNPA